MIEVIKFRISLLRERLSIHGWQNVAMFSLLIATVLMGGKILLCLGPYDQTVLFLTVFFCCSCGDGIFPKKTRQNSYTVKLLFDKVNAPKYRTYLVYRNYLYIQLLYLFLACPVRSEDFKFFSAVFLLFEGYIALLIMIRYYVSPSRFAAYKWSAPMVLCLFLFFNNRVPFFTSEALIIDLHFIPLLLAVGILLITFTVKRIDKDVDNSGIHRIQFRPRCKILQNNRDFLYVIRTTAWVEPAVVVLFSGVMSFALKETLEDMILTNMLSFSYVFSEIYIKLLKYENKHCIFVYTQKPPSYMRKDKIKNTLLVVFPTLLILAIPLSFVTSVWSVVSSLLLSTVLFLVTALIFRVNMEKGHGYHTVITNREQLWFALIYGAEVLLVSLIQTYLMH